MDWSLYRGLLVSLRWSMYWATGPPQTSGTCVRVVPNAYHSGRCDNDGSVSGCCIHVCPALCYPGEWTFGDVHVFAYLYCTHSLHVKACSILECVYYACSRLCINHTSTYSACRITCFVHFNSYLYKLVAFPATVHCVDTVVLMTRPVCTRCYSYRECVILVLYLSWCSLVRVVWWKVHHSQ
jgi:hypothetical protein